MAWNPSPDVADCREVARKWKCKQVVILGINQDSGIYRVASYGETRALCDEAKKINDLIYKMVETGQIELGETPQGELF